MYGWASFVWRIVICVSMTITAATLFHGAGIALACVAVVLWLGLPTLHFVKYFVIGKPGEQPRRIRFVLTAGSANAPWCPARRIASMMASSLTQTTTPSDSRNASTAFRQMRGT